MKIWEVIQPNGERTYLQKPPLEGFEQWWKGGLRVVVREYELTAVLYPPEKAWKK